MKTRRIAWGCLVGVHCKFTNRDDPSLILGHDVFFPRQVQFGQLPSVIKGGVRIPPRNGGPSSQKVSIWQKRRIAWRMIWNITFVVEVNMIFTLIVVISCMKRHASGCDNECCWYLIRLDRQKSRIFMGLKMWAMRWPSGLKMWVLLYSLYLQIMSLVCSRKIQVLTLNLMRAQYFTMHWQLESKPLTPE